MRGLTPAMYRALAMFKRADGELHRLPGGLWVDDPKAWERGEKDAVDDEWVKVETLRGLARRGLVELAGGFTPGGFPIDAEARLTEFGRLFCGLPETKKDPDRP